jgi:hypothetical protein
MTTNKTTLTAIATAGLLAACNSPAPSDDAIARQVADTLVQACPMASPNDENARALCAANLSDNKFLGGVMAETFQWGAQGTLGDYDFANSNMNRFNVFVWRRMYLSLLMFPGDMSIEQTSDGKTLVHLAYQFRNQLDMGSYPYPFWHSAKKWTSYQQAREIILEFKGGKWLGALRSADQDATRPQVAHTWSGQWHWERGGQEMPYVSLYTYLLSPNNPNTARLDTAYRALSDGMRQNSCLMCHSPDNYAANKQLEFFNYPNQALYARQDIIDDLQKNSMPPVNNTLGLPVGITVDADRQELLALAQEFKAAGDAALAYEGEVKSNH